MLNFNRNDRLPDPKDPKLPARPAAPLGSTAAPQPMAAGAPAARPPAAPAPATPSSAVPAEPMHVPSAAADAAGSKLSIGPNINLKGVEISNCDVLVIEGNVDATITSKVMEIAKPGRFSGTANIDIAEIHGDFSGELTVRTKLVVHGTGRVTGTIRYGKLVVAEGGILNGELKQMDSPGEPAATSPAAATPSMPRPLLNPQPH
jgi:cytoskeletal protein CcmA (bactofilin family)